ncbi:MAG: alanine--tRNA ligase, partial [Candidatus Methanomethylicota archaeon]
QNIGINLNELIKLISPLETLFGILDHTKCLTFMLADGIVPSNTGEGYLARLVLRRTMKLMKLLNIELPLTEIIDMQIKLWGETFPRLKEMRSIILDMVSIEEERYKRTLAKGSSIIERICKNLTKKSENKLSIDTLIELYDSHGIPPEITQKVASKFGVEVEIPNNFYAIVAAKHQAKTKKIKEEKIPFHIDVTQFPKTKLLYYDDPYKFTFKAKVLGVIDNYIILDKTAFYPEGGGQPSDTGYIIWNSNKASIIDVQKINDVVIHRVDGPLPPIGSIITGIIDEKRRLALMRNHTATHILLAAATKVLGRHIWQAGTQKDVNRSRLDITHYKQLSYDEVRKIELLANNYVMANLKVKTSFMNRTEAEQKFGFRLYQGGVVPGRDIRVVEIGDIDVQACGGTHCKSTGEIGLIKILRAHRIQDGVIRLEFACGEAALIYIQNQEALINKIAKTLNTQISYIPETIEKLKLEVKSLRHKSRILWKHYMSILKEQLIKNQKNIGQFKLITGTLSELSMKDLIDLAAAIIKEVQNSIVSLFNIDGEVVTFVIMAEENAVKLGLNCHTLAKEISQILSGKGGGRNNLAQGSGKNAGKIKDAVNLIEQFLSSITK